MIGGKKWVLVLRQEQYNWVKATAKQAGVRGSDIVRAMFDELMDDQNFIESLSKEKWKLELQKIHDKKAALEEEERALMSRLKGKVRERETVTA